MSKVNHFLIHRVIEHIRECGVEFDTADLDEHGVDKVIAGYGWHPLLNDTEKTILYQDLFDIAMRYELAEVVRSMNPDEFLAIHGEVSPDVICPEVEPAPPCEGPVLA